MNEKYLIVKSFAHDSELFEKGEHVECSLEFAQKYSKNLELIKESKGMDVDTKAISEAIREGLASFAPKVDQKVEKKGMTGKEYIVDGLVKKTVNITTGSQGGSVTTTFTEDPFTDVIASSLVVANVPVISLGEGTDNAYKFNIVNSFGTEPGVVSEGSVINASQPTLSSFTINIAKQAYSYIATEEIMMDGSALITELNNSIPIQMSTRVEDAIINGSVTGFTGIINDANTVVVAKVSGQTADTINFTNITDMYVSQKNPQLAVWIVGPKTMARVMTLKDDAGNAMFVAPNGFAQAPNGTLLGRPILISHKCPALGDEGDIIFANLNAYKLVTKGGMNVKSSDQLYFNYDQRYFRFTHRVGGRPASLLWTSDDGTEISDFVVLEAR